MYFLFTPLIQLWCPDFWIYSAAPVVRMKPNAHQTQMFHWSFFRIHSDWSTLCSPVRPASVLPSLLPSLLPWCVVQGSLKPSNTDVLISFLPLAHMFERVVEVQYTVLDLHTCTCFVLCVPLQVHCMLNVHDIHISYLPLAHMFERVIQVCGGETHKLNLLLKKKLIKI